MNLVFNRWDESGNPLPNLSELSYKLPNPTSLPFFIDDVNFNIKKCTLEDINKNETFYFIIAINYSYKFFIQHSEIFIPKEIAVLVEFLFPGFNGTDWLQRIWVNTGVVNHFGNGHGGRRKILYLL